MHTRLVAFATALTLLPSLAFAQAGATAPPAGRGAAPATPAAGSRTSTARALRRARGHAGYSVAA